MKHPIRRRLMYLGFQGLRGVAWLLPLGVGRHIGAAFGWLAYVALGAHRNRTLKHLSYAFGPTLSAAQRRAVARGVFMNLGRNAMEWLQLPKLSLNKGQQFVVGEGIEHVREALAKGRGAIMVTGHIGNWEILSLYLLGYLGFAGGVLARPLRYPEYESWLIGLRARSGIPTIPRGSTNEVVRRLRANELIGMLLDQDISSMDGVFVEFFGHPAYTPVGPAALSLMTGAPIVPCFAIRESNRFRVIVESPLDVPATGDRPQALKQLTQAWSDVIESTIRRYPDQWVWMHRRWKTQPVVSGQPAPALARGGPGWSVVSKESEPNKTSARRSGQPAASLVLCAVCCVLCAVLSGCSRSAAPTKSATGATPGKTADKQMSGFTLTGYEVDGAKRWELDGTGATFENDIVTIRRPDGVGYEIGRTTYLTASLAQVNQTNRHVRFEHDVTIHTSDGLWLSTPVLHWIPDQDRVATDHAVRIETDHMLVRGRGASGLTQLKHTTILEDIELVLNPSDHDVPGQSPPGSPGATAARPPGPPKTTAGAGGSGEGRAGGAGQHVTITCDGPLTFDYENHIATFEDNVHVRDHNGDLYSDKLVAYLNQTTRTIRYAEAIGRVRIHQRDNTAHSDRAVYEPGLGKVTLVGRPSLLVYPEGESKAQMSFGGLAAGAPAAQQP